MVGIPSSSATKRHGNGIAAAQKSPCVRGNASIRRLSPFKEKASGNGSSESSSAMEASAAGAVLGDPPLVEESP